MSLTVVRVYCELNSDPQAVNIDFAGGFEWQIPYTVYESTREALGLPDLVCPGGDITIPTDGLD